MPRSAAQLAEVVVLHPEIPRLSRRDLARLEMIEILRDLDPESQRVVVDQLLETHARIRRHTPTAAIVRGERRPVTWRRGQGPRWLVAPESRRWLYRMANG